MSSGIHSMCGCVDVCISMHISFLQITSTCRIVLLWLNCFDVVSFTIQFSRYFCVASFHNFYRFMFELCLHPIGHIVNVHDFHNCIWWCLLLCCAQNYMWLGSQWRKNDFYDGCKRLSDQKVWRTYHSMHSAVQCSLQCIQYEILHRCVRPVSFDLQKYTVCQHTFRTNF